MNKYLLSIIIPVYNGDSYLEDCLNSIVKVNFFKKIEVIIIDDGSTDNSAIIYEKYTNRYSNIKSFKNTNHGVSYSRNEGIKKASGKYIMFVDCDDLLKDNYDDDINETLLNEDYDIIYHSKYFTEEDVSKEEVLSYILTYNDKNIKIPGPCSKLFNRDFLFDNNINFKEDLINAEDILFNIESLLKASKYLLKKGSYYIVRHNSISSTKKFEEEIIPSEISFNKYVQNSLGKFYNNSIQSITFLLSIRTLAYRISFLKSYSKARRVYQKIRNSEFFQNNFKNLKIDTKLSSYYFYVFFKNRWYLLLYLLCKIKNKKNENDYFEIL